MWQGHLSYQRMESLLLICSHEPICHLFGTEHCTTEDFNLGQVDINDSRDELDPKAMRQDIKVLC